MKDFAIRCSLSLAIGLHLVLLSAPSFAEPVSGQPQALASTTATPRPYATFEATKGRPGTSRVWINGRAILTFDEHKDVAARGVSERLNALHAQGGLNPGRVRYGRRGDCYAVLVGNQHVFVFAERFARRQGEKPVVLAQRYARQLREGLALAPVAQAQPVPAEARPVIPARQAVQMPVEPQAAVAPLAAEEARVTANPAIVEALASSSAIVADATAALPVVSAPRVASAFATYETTKGRPGTSRVWIGDRLLFAFDGDNGAFAKRVSDKLVALNKRGALRAERVMPARRKKEKLYVVSVGGEDLMTFDHAFANRQGTPPTTLAMRYVSQLRVALGGRSLQQQIAQTASRGGYGRQQVGVASWYGGFFHGRRAADGSRFDQNDFTAAHKTLPFGTLLLVTNLKTQKSTLVRVSDRGPYIPGRMIDLSRGAAKAIGMLGSGVSKVRVTIFKPKQ